jgi:cytochrome subunit of sulfide dehydrogenase
VRGSTISKLALPLVFMLASAGNALGAGRGMAQMAAACTGCHGIAGVSQGAIPSLAGRPADELTDLLLGYRDGTITGTIMNHLVQGYTPDELAALAHYFSELQAP